MASKEKLPFAQIIESSKAQSGLSWKSFADRLGLTTETLRLYRNGSQAPPPTKYEELAANLGVSKRDLVVALSGDRSRDEAAIPHDDFAGPGDDPDAVVAVPQYGHVGAGDGRVPPKRVGTLHVTLAEYAHDFAEPPRRVSSELGDRYAPGNRFGYFIIDGDSAAPVFFDRERVPVQLLDPERTFANDLLYVFRWQGEYQIKRLRLRPDGTVRASSLNPSIDPFEFKVADEEDFAVVALARVSQKQQLYTALVGRLFDAIH